MSKFLIKGGNELRGEISVSGAKNNAQIILPATILSEEAVTIKNLPY